MGARNSVLTGSAGEHYVLYRLHRAGILAAQSPAGARDADILVFNEEGLGRRIQVKTRTMGADGGWAMLAKHEQIRDPGLIYAFVDLEREPPTIHFIPSTVVADVVTLSHRTWLQLPGRGGQAHRDSPVRRLRPSYAWPVPGFDAGWLDQYLDRWDLLWEPPAVG